MCSRVEYFLCLLTDLPFINDIISLLITIETLKLFFFRYRVVAQQPETGESLATEGRVNVLNVNDNPPIFKQNIFTFAAPLDTRR